MDPASVAKSNFLALKRNSYPGRVIIAGLVGEFLVQVYAIMGRSAGSRNRFFGCEGGRIFTGVADPAKEQGNPELTLYNAMLEPRGNGHGRTFVVSNGKQTDLVAKLYGESQKTSLHEALRSSDYEPDGPNFTSRITAVSQWFNFGDVGLSRFSILRKSPWTPGCDRYFFEINSLESGFGHFISTYHGDGNPLPPFEGEPLLMPLPSTAEEVAEKYWDALNHENRVSLAVKFIPRSGESTVVIKNKYEKVAQATAATA